MMTPEYAEYIEASAKNTAEMVAAVDAMKEELTDVLNPEHCCAINQIAKATQDELIGESFRAALAPFMQPAEEESEDDEMRAPR